MENNVCSNIYFIWRQAFTRLSKKMKSFKMLCTKYMESCEAMRSSTHLFAYISTVQEMFSPLIWSEGKLHRSHLSIIHILWTKHAISNFNTNWFNLHTERMWMVNHMKRFYVFKAIIILIQCGDAIQNILYNIAMFTMWIHSLNILWRPYYMTKFSRTLS